MWKCFLVLFLCSVFKITVSQIKIEEYNEISYQIVGIFDKSSYIPKQAFNESVRNAAIGEYRLQPIILEPTKVDTYFVWRKLCSDEDTKAIAIFGPQHPIADGAVRDQCAKSNVPHLQATWQPLDPDFEDQTEIEDDEEYDEDEKNYCLDKDDAGTKEKETEPDQNQPDETEIVYKNISINFYPRSDEISIAYAKLLKYYNWESFAALYEDDYGLLRIQKVLAEHTDQYPVTARKLDPEGDNYKIFKELKKFQISRILLDSHISRVLKYINEAKALNMADHYRHFILVSMDASMLVDNLKPLQSNFTWLSLTEYEKLSDAKHVLSGRVGTWKDSKASPPVYMFETEALIMDDIANHVLKALQNMSGDLNQPQYSICENKNSPWDIGAKLQDKILKTKSRGVTGDIQFDDYGRRINYILYVNEIYVSEMATVGRWNSSDPDTIIDERPNTQVSVSQLTSKHFIIVSNRAKPYFFKKETCDGDCDEKFEGFSVDLVKNIFELLKSEMNLNYTYEFSTTEYEHGTYDPTTKKWNGLIGVLLDKKADLAVSDLTITEKRKKVVDFSVPFMSLGISILYTKEHKVDPPLFSFLNPFSFEVWMYTATAYCVVSIVLFICARISTLDWENPQPCNKEPDELENIWNFKNCLWLTMGSIMTQGCDILPKGGGSRWVCGMWWFFGLIVSQSYIAQLAASMTSELENEPPQSVEDLAKQTKILYGALKGGSTLEFFKNSKDKMYRRMYENMASNPVVLVNTNDEGEKRVLKGKNQYAFFMESSTIEYKLKRDCELKKVGGELDSKDYGIAMPANSPFRSSINRAILRLKEMTQLDEIKKKWWEEKYVTAACDEEADGSDVEGDLELKNLAGVFIVLILGIIIAFLITAAEFMDEVRNIVVREKVTHKEAFVKELRASLNFFQLQKPILRNPSRAASLAGSVEALENKQEKRAAFIDNFLDCEKIA